jgi:hypothetical protein
MANYLFKRVANFRTLEATPAMISKLQKGHHHEQNFS